MMSKTKIRQLRHERRMEEARLLKERKKFAEKYGLALSANGSYVAPKLKKEFVPYKPEPVYRRETPYYPSTNSLRGVATKKEPNRYTGSLIKGIATMHKSNAVPVFDEKHAEEISKMRRG